MKFVLWLEILTMIGYYSLMAVGFNQAILGHWGFVFISVMLLLFITLSGFAPIPGRWGEIPATMILSRRLFWYFATPEFKEKYFLRFVLHCLMGDYRRFVVKVMDKHNIDQSTLYSALMEYYQGRMHFLHDQWAEIATQTFITYGEVDRVYVARVQDNFNKLTPEGMISQFKDSLDKNNLDLMIENYLFYQFINQN